jgi:regulator of protease activity HflC (stomatin/prohibitin superfamily)
MLGFAVLLVVLAIILPKMVVSVPQGSEFIVERKGKFHRVLKPGLHLSLIPFVDRIARTLSTEPVVLTIPDITEPNKENLPLKIQSQVSYQISDSARTYANVADHEQSLIALAHQEIRSAVKDYTLDEVLLERKDFEDRVQRWLEDGVRNWGMKITGFRVLAMTPPEAVLEALKAQAAQERARRAKERGQQA